MDNNFTRSHHQRIASILQAMDADFLNSIECFFGGGTAIAMLIDEYRTSVDIDFMVSNRAGYRTLRSSVFDHQLHQLFKPGQTPTLTREVRSDRDGVRTVLQLDGISIKFEIVLEGRITLDANQDICGVPTLSRNCLYAEKLLANADRGLDPAHQYKDIMDLIVMQLQWGPIPQQALTIARNAYGSSIDSSYRQAIATFAQDSYLLRPVFKSLDVRQEYQQEILAALEEDNLFRLPDDGRDKTLAPGLG